MQKGATMVTATQTRRQWLKHLAPRHSLSWRMATLPRTLDGVTVVETARELIYFEDGVCTRVTSFDEDTPARSLVGLTWVLWIDVDGNPVAGHRPGARAVLWRAPPERGLTTQGEMTVALTGRALRHQRVESHGDSSELFARSA